MLDALPGEIRNGTAEGRDRPGELIAMLQRLRLPLSSKADLTDRLEAAGFSPPVAAWASTSLRPVTGGAGFEWLFDLPGIAQMYRCARAKLAGARGILASGSSERAGYFLPACWWLPADSGTELPSRPPPRLLPA